MKYFVVHISTQTGEHEYGEQLVSEARDATGAKRRARIDLLETLGNPGKDTWEDDQLDLFDRIVTIEEIREIPAADFAVLQQYLPVVNA